MLSYRQPGTVLKDHTFTVPLDHARPGGEQIELFAREVVGADKQASELPWLLFLQGGPGFGANRPNGREGWLNRALDDYRVLLLDRGGRRSPESSLYPVRWYGGTKRCAGVPSLASWSTPRKGRAEHHGI